jgi:hypothetical protein
MPDSLPVRPSRKHWRVAVFSALAAAVLVVAFGPMMLTFWLDSYTLPREKEKLPPGLLAKIEKLSALAKTLPAKREPGDSLGNSGQRYDPEEIDRPHYPFEILARGYSSYLDYLRDMTTRYPDHEGTRLCYEMYQAFESMSWDDLLPRLPPPRSEPGEGKEPPISESAERSAREWLLKNKPLFEKITAFIENGEPPAEPPAVREPVFNRLLAEQTKASRDYAARGGEEWRTLPYERAYFLQVGSEEDLLWLVPSACLELRARIRYEDGGPAAMEEDRLLSMRLETIVNRDRHPRGPPFLSLWLLRRLETWMALGIVSPEHAPEWAEAMQGAGGEDDPALFRRAVSSSLLRARDDLVYKAGLPWTHPAMGYDTLDYDPVSLGAGRSWAFEMPMPRLNKYLTGARKAMWRKRHLAEVIDAYDACIAQWADRLQMDFPSWKRTPPPSPDRLLKDFFDSSWPRLPPVLDEKMKDRNVEESVRVLYLTPTILNLARSALSLIADRETAMAAREACGKDQKENPWFDYFTTEPFVVREETSSTLIYSPGPDLVDDHARIEYDPTNGSMSGGDIWIRIPRAALGK